MKREESSHSSCLWTSQTRLPISTFPPWFPGGKHPSQITTWSISGEHYSVCSWQWGRISHPQLPAYGLRQEPHILICSAEFLSSEEVDPGHLLQLTSVVIDFWYIHTDGCTCCVIDSLLKCENRENGWGGKNEVLNLICSDTEPVARLSPLLTWASTSHLYRRVPGIIGHVPQLGPKCSPKTSPPLLEDNVWLKVQVLDHLFGWTGFYIVCIYSI